jgi:hypothetical protein
MKRLDHAQRGRLGGQRTLARHGPHQFQCIGRLGYEVTLERHFAGDLNAMQTFLNRCRQSATRYDERTRCQVRSAQALS